jgi:hypothetical protein
MKRPRFIPRRALGRFDRPFGRTWIGGSMYTEFLVHAENPAAVREQVAAAGGRLLHALSAHLLVISLPDTVSIGSIRRASLADSGRLEGTERALAEAWLARFGQASRASERSRRTAAPPIPWDAPGFTPPKHVAGGRGPAADAVSRATNTPTSVTLTGSVAVGLVLVSGPSDPPLWTPVHGALKYVSAAGDGTVWGVNADSQVFRWSGSTWHRRPGQLKQVSVGNSITVWGVNSADKIFRWDGQAWDQVSGALKHVAVANDGTTWGVNRNDEIFRWNGGSWDQIAGRLKQISTGSEAAVWGVNSSDEIFFWNGAGWTQVAGRLKHVSVASDGSVLGVNADDEIFAWNSRVWVQLPGRLKQVSAASASVAWGVNSDDRIYSRQPAWGLALSEAEKNVIMAEVMEGLTFLGTADLNANVSFVHDWKDVSVDAAPGAGNDYEAFEAPWRNAALKALGFAPSAAGSVAFVNALRETHETDWAYVGYFTKYPLYHFAYADVERVIMDARNGDRGTGEINSVFAHETCHIFGAADEYGECDCGGSGHFDVPNNNCRRCTNGQVDCLMNDNSLSLCSWSRGQLGWSPWETLAGALKCVAAGNDGTVWGVNVGDEVFRWNGSSWTRVPGALKQISVGNAVNVVGVNRNDEIYRWNGDSWTRLPGALAHISIAADGSVWGVNASDKVFRFTGSIWHQLPGRLNQVSVGAADHVWGVNDDDEIYRWHGDGWTQIAGALDHVSVGADGSVWGVNGNDEIFRGNGTRWEQIPGALKQISVGADRLVWGVNKNNSIFRLR